MKTRAQARQRLHFGVLLMAGILSLMGAQQLRLKLSGPSYLTAHVFAATITP